MINEFYFKGEEGLVKKLALIAIVMSMTVCILSGCSKVEDKPKIENNKVLATNEEKNLQSQSSQSEINKVIDEKIIASKEEKVEQKIEQNSNPTVAVPEIKPEKKHEEAPNKTDKIVYLTFDDAMSNNTIKILDTLKKYNVKATFFPNIIDKPENREFQRQMLKRMAAEGHSIGNHTASHNYSYVYSSVDNYIADTNKLNDFIYEAAGIRPNILRFPGGSNNQVSWRYSGKEFMGKQLIPKMKELGYQYFDWNVSSSDASATTLSKDAIIKNVLNGAKGKQKAIVLMHESAAKTTTADALSNVIEGLKAMGYNFDVLTKDSYTCQFTK
ncbi:polysaccharide deacetylase [Clostridiales bacterium oral taxon 876 str. F0540]|nr:polysaccharide deacetylase [Clostridiales bacterium oral taxon 876 str. F0540]